MPSYRFKSNARDYSSWEIFDNSTNCKTDIDIQPHETKLFTDDIFELDNANKVHLLSSPCRASQIPGVLVLSDNKTYGRKNKRLLYKCVPDNKSLPSFLVPYEIKQVGFSKVYTNIYVTFTFTGWDDKHPHGMLQQVIGPVDILANFYEYQLHCKQLNISFQKFQKDTNSAFIDETKLIDTIKQTYPTIEDRENWHIFSIDPNGCADFDDAFSIRSLDNGSTQVSIYIANVSVWIDALGLWDSFSKRVSTIYLPDKKRPMLPPILSDKLCSLQSGVTRVALYMDISINNGDITDIAFGNCFVKLFKNYCYEESALLTSPKYNELLQVTRLLSAKNKYCEIVDSHDVVCYLMILMNYHCAKKMILFRCGLFRSNVVADCGIIPNTVPEDVSKFIKIFKSSRGQYVNGNQLTNVRHDLLNLDAYIHITSPIRRLVDLLNMIKFQQITNILSFTDKVDAFYNKWTYDLDYINVSMKSIRKIQNDCSLLELCMQNPIVMSNEYSGYILHAIKECADKNQYLVFLPDLKIVSKITTNSVMCDYQHNIFKLYLFNDEDNLKKKIRLQLQA